jgi:hypothetical protein
MIDPREHLECITRLAAEIKAALDRGDLPFVADAKLIQQEAAILELEFRRMAIAALPVRTAAEDKASQYAMDGEGNRL